MPKSAELCIVPGCKNKRHCRGVCVSCYFACRREIEAGGTTDSDLVRKRMWLKPNRTGRPSTNIARKLLARMRGAK